MNITARSSRDEILSHAEELLDIQESELITLRSQHRVLWFIVALVTTWGILF